MSDWRLITDAGVGAAAGLATDEALMLHYARGGQPDSEATLRLYTYAPHAALVGRYQHLEAEVDRDACAQLGIAVSRRPTGGGAIVMGPDQLGVAVTTRAPADAAPRDLLAQYAAGILAGLRSLGVHAEFRGKNDLQVGGRKIAGLGLYVDDAGALLFHASVLAGLDIALMLAALRIPGAKLADKGIERVEDRITTVSRETGRPHSGADLQAAIADGFASQLGVRLTHGQLDATERELAERRITERYEEPGWLAGRIETTGTRGTASLKTPAGLVRVYAGVQNGAISSVMIAGDFSVMPSRLLALEAALRWCRADPERIRAIARRECAGDELSVGPDPIAAAVWSATERALARAAAAQPVRPTGSCYFPDGDRAALGVSNEEMVA
jgi:lipoate-protein ligase A